MKTKLITFAVPSYNSEKYLSKCVDSLLNAGEEAEILIINDGSNDQTGAIADRYEQRYPHIVRAVHKENGGHGSGVNRGLEEASGLYYKVVDSDDWLDEQALRVLMDTLRSHVAAPTLPDLYIVNFVYDHVADGTKYVSRYAKNFPIDAFFGWEDIKPLRLWKVLIMHSLIYRTKKLRECGLRLPEHTFYVDNIYAYQPLPYMRKLYYLDIDLYHYFIGRADQSVTIENIVGRYRQQISVMREMLKAHSSAELKKCSRPLRKYAYHALMAIMMNTTFFTTAKDSQERREDLRALWSELKDRDKPLYRKLRFGTMYALLDPLPWRCKGKLTTGCYKFLCRHVKLG